ncbi:MAG: translation initiation factor IF-2 [Planctomycetota bacterium]
MAKTLRVHNIAKELGVSSKDIVAKCEAEGVPDITNHMSAVKVGLAVTIRQWFEDAAEEEGGVATATAVETAEKVDLTKVKKKAARKKKTAAKKKEEPAEEPSDDAPAKATPKAKAAPSPVVEEAEAETPVEPAAPAEPVSPVVPVEPVAEAAAPSPVEAEPAKPKVRLSKPTPPEPVQPKGVENVPDRPDVVKPVGEQLTERKKVKLAGPKVVRVEKPEPVEAPRRPRGGGGGGGGQAPGEVPGISRSRGPARGGGVRNLPDEAPARGGGGGGGRGGRGGGGGGGGRRSLSSRRGRSADAIPTGPSQLSEADMMELDAKLKGAPGFLKQRRRNLKRQEGGSGPAQTAVEVGGKVEIEEPITIKGLSSATGIRTADIVKWLFKKGVFANVNSAIETEAAEEICLEYDIELVVKAHETARQRIEEEFANREAVDTQARPPVVTVLGHVDHGKTSLLDKVRKADVAAHEDGGITQHVGAYRVTVEGTDNKDKTVVFLDTPGHAAFTAMRSRGASMTDLVVLVIAADDGVMPTTIESINHAKAAEVPIVVALNKIDLPGADTNENLQRVYGQLAEHGLNPTAWGGDIEVIPTSAETGQGIPELLEMLDLQAELLELTADYGGPARGTVIEGEMQIGRGSVARILVQDGQLKVGDFIGIGRAFGRVRDMTNDRGQSIKEAGPATPVELSGIDQIPDAGDKFYITSSLKKAESIAEQVREDERQQAMASQTKVTLDNFAATIEAGKVQELRVVLKADVQGSIETLKQSLAEIGNNEVAVKVLHGAVGAITESDIDLADASDGVIIGFHVTATSAVREIAEQRGVELRFYRVIYELIDDLKKALEGMLAPETKEEQLGMAEVKQVFKIGKVGNIAGCLVVDGAITSDATTRLVRDGAVITENRKIESLRRVKDEAKEVRAGTECGIRLDGFEDVKPGDQIVAYRVEEVARKLD